MKEIEIKKILIEFLMKKKNENIVIGSEFRFDFGTRRADVISFEDEELVAYEIKGSGDNLERLQPQISSYKKYFDKCYIVCEPENIKQVRKACPKPIGIIEVKDDSLKIVREAKKICAHSKVCLASTMSSATLKNLLKGKKNGSKHELCERISLQYRLDEIRDFSRGELYSKVSSSYSIFFSELGEKIHSDDILTLTRMPSCKLILLNEY